MYQTSMILTTYNNTPSRTSTRPRAKQRRRMTLLKLIAYFIALIFREILL